MFALNTGIVHEFEKAQVQGQLLLGDPLMVPLPEAIIAVLLHFAVLFSKPVRSHVQVLWAGAILCRGPHTVAAVLCVVGLEREQGFGEYHRVLSPARW